LELIEDSTLRNADYVLAANMVEKTVLEVKKIINIAKASLKKNPELQ
jgi:hypothetical protein